MFSPDLHEMYARERQRDFLHEAAADTLAHQASATQPRPSTSLMARLGRWLPRLRPGAVLSPLSPHHAHRRHGDAHAGGN